MANRVINYDGQIPLTTDLLSTNLNFLQALGFLAGDILGTGTIASGLPCAATAPASLSVVVGSGRLYQLGATDGAAYSDLGTNATIITKQGILLSQQTIALTPPATSGFSVAILIEASFSEIDGQSTVLEFYNSANPQSPLSGPEGSGAPLNTSRSGSIVLTAKYGTAAATGTQTTPTPDAANIGLWVVTLQNGQSTITSSNIAQYASSSWIGESLTQKISAATAQTLFAPIAAGHTDTFVVGSGGVTSGQTVFTLGATPPSAAYLTVVVDGATLLPSDYSLTGSSLTLTTGITTGQSMVARYGAAVLALVPSAGVITDAMLAAPLRGTSVAFTAPGAGAVTTTVQAKLAQTISPFDFGCVGDGTTDDTANFQAALNAAAGGTVYLPVNTPSGASTAKFLVGNITVPLNTSIVGQMSYPTILLTTAGLQVNPYSLGSQLRTKAGATITLNDGCSLDSLLVIHAGLSLPATNNTQATALLGQFADTAITAASCSVRLEKIMVLGYTRLCSITNPGGTSLSSRTYIRDVMGDNTNGILVDDSADVSHFSGCHMWPFLTAAISGVSDANLQRAGSAYYFGNVDDWFTAFDCFSYAYNVAYECVDTSAISFLRCQADYTATGGGLHAFFVTHSVSHSEYVSIVDCQAIGYLSPAYLNPGPGAPAGNDTLQVLGNKFIFAAGGVGLEVPTGYLMASDNLFQGSGTGIQLDVGCTGALIQNNKIIGASTPINNAAPANVVIHDNAGYNPIGASQSTHLVGASPYTYTAGASPETLYAFAGTSISEVAVGGVSLLPASTSAMVTIQLGPNEAAVFFYTGTLTISTFKH